MTRRRATLGEILKQEELALLEMSEKHLADLIGQDLQVINRIVNGRSAGTAEVALKLAAAFRTPSEFRSNAQKAVDLHAARAKLPEAQALAHDREASSGFAVYVANQSRADRAARPLGVPPAHERGTNAGTASSWAFSAKPS